MGMIPRLVLSLGIIFAVTSSAQATIGCAVISSTAEAKSVHLYRGPNDDSSIIREIPLGDIVEYPQPDLAPAQVDGWSWVRHDITQDVIWQIGISGWIKVENISDCG